MNGYEPDDLNQKQAWNRLSPEVREARYQQGVERKAIVEAVLAKKGQLSERAALLEVAPGVSRSTFRKWQRNYQAFGFSGLVERRIPRQNQSPISPSVREVICTLRRDNADVGVETIVAHVAQHHQIKTNASTVKRILREAGLGRRPGPVSGSPEAGQPEQRLEYGGMRFLDVALAETGYLAAMSQGVAECMQAMEGSPEGKEVDRSARDEWGRFLPEYN